MQSSYGRGSATGALGDARKLARIGHAVERAVLAIGVRPLERPARGIAAALSTDRARGADATGANGRFTHIGYCVSIAILARRARPIERPALVHAAGFGRRGAGAPDAAGAGGGVDPAAERVTRPAAHSPRLLIAESVPTTVPRVVHIVSAGGFVL